MSHHQELEEGNQLLLDFEKHGGLMPVVVQDAQDNRILMVAWANRQSFEETLRTGLATFWSTSRNELWTKGLTSGNTLSIIQILVDCDQDALVYRVHRNGGGVCHTRDPKTGRNRESCFYRHFDWNEKKLYFV